MSRARLLDHIGPRICGLRLPVRVAGLPGERAAVQEALFGTNPTNDTDSDIEQQLVQRRRTDTDFLNPRRAIPAAAVHEPAYRNAAQANSPQTQLRCARYEAPAAAPTR